MSALFTNARGYEKMMGRWSAELAPRFLDFARSPARGHFLDAGCGTGVLAEALLRRGGDSTVVGIDPSETFIAAARERVADRRARFELGDILELNFANGEFNAALSLLVLMFVSDPSRAARELCRVVRPGGVVAACVWGHEGLEMTSLFWEEAQKLDPTVAERRVIRHPYREGTLKSLWVEAGLLDVEETPLDMTMRFDSFEDFWEPFLGGNSPSGIYATGLARTQRDALSRALRQRILGESAADGAFTLAARAWAARGVVGAAR
jgi:SAM-dependent methyltransferase